MKNGKLVYGQSGGPSAVINASAYGVITEALKHDEITEVLVMKNGIGGILNEEFYKLEDYVDQLELLKYTPGSGFGSIRHKINQDDLKRIVEVCKKNNIRYFAYNGGNDSMDTCMQLSEYIKDSGYEMKVIGVPKTVDNDLPLTDHTPGFSSAAKFVANTVMQVKLDSSSYSPGKVTLIEVMGRNTGWLTASSIAGNISDLGPDMIILPEMVFDEEKFLDRVNEIYNEKKNCLIVLSEGIKDSDNNIVGQFNRMTDAFGHSQLGGVGIYLGDIIEEKLGIKYRAIELSTPQRSASFIRSESDVNEAINVGNIAVKKMIDGETGKMVVIKRDKMNVISYDTENLELVANKEKIIPEYMIDSEGFTVTNEFIDYVLPLIKGEYPQLYENGIQRFFNISKK